MPNSDKVFIRDLEILMSAGINDHERVTKQRIIINVVLDVESNENKDLSKIEEVVCYHTLLNKIKELALSRHHDLLEKMAEDIAVICLSNALVQASSVKIEKPDIIEEVSAVGVEIKRCKP